MANIILASKSPRRIELMQQIGYDPIVIPSTVEEVITKSDPAEIVQELSLQKAEDVAGKLIEDSGRNADELSKNIFLETAENYRIVLGADTVVASEGKILGKPKDKDDAVQMLQSLSGKAHEVYTGVTILKISDNEILHRETFAVETRVYVQELTREEIEVYVESGEPMDKAGAYGIQGIFGRHISGIEGDYSNVVGLPVHEVYMRLKKLNAAPVK